MSGKEIETYDPLNVPKPFGEGAWIVDGPEIRMDYGPTSIPFPTRMVVVRLADGGLWLHSPIEPAPELLEQLKALGPVRHLVAPNSIHYWYMAHWLALFPEAQSYSVPGLADNPKKPFRVDMVLEPGANPVWQDEIEWLLIPGTKVSEAVFHVRRARLCILTDLIENFELPRVKSRVMRIGLILAGGVDPDGKAPIDLRATFWPKLRAIRPLAARMLGWDPERVVMAHGRPYATGGTAELRRALRWALPKEKR